MTDEALRGTPPHEDAVVAPSGHGLDDGYVELAQQRDTAHRSVTRRRAPSWVDGALESNESTAESAPPSAGELVVPIAPVRIGRSNLVGVIGLLVPLLFVVHMVRAVLHGESGWPVVGVIAGVVALVALAYARPVRLIGKGGEARFSAEGMRVRFDGLMDAEWFVPAAAISEVKCANTLKPRSDDSATLGLTHRDATVAIRFRSPSPRVPVRGGFFVPAMLGNRGARVTMPVPNTTVNEIMWRTDAVDLAALQERIGRALQGEAIPAEPSRVYRVGSGQDQG